MEFEKRSIMGGDCTTSYKVSGYSAKTAFKFVEEVIKNFPSEWGKISIEVSYGVSYARSIEYKHGKLLDEIPAEWENIMIDNIISAGGWSNMDYRIYPKKEDNVSREVRVHDEQARRRIGQRIAELRRERGMTQDMLAELTGIRRPHISRIEMGKYSVGLDTLEAIAKALGCRVDFVTAM